MAFKKIDKIVLQDNEAGEAFGGHIYALTVQMGYTSGPTKITLSIANSDGSYQPRDASGADKGSFKDILNTSDIWELKVGDLEPFKLHLISYNIKTSVGQRVLTLQFCDTSVLLDKVFVGLINRHVKATDKSQDNRPYGISVKSSVDLKLNCMKCDGSSDMMVVTPGETIIPGTKNSKFGGEDGIQRDIDIVQSNGTRNGKQEIGKAYVEPSSRSNFKTNGGMIILGRETFVEQKCDIPEVDYNFSDLIYALNQDYSKSQDETAYITIKADSAGKLTLQDRNENYRASYTGTLREVLNSWCSDMAYSFTWDLSEEKLVGIDLSKDAITDDSPQGSGERYIDKIKKVVADIITKDNTHPSSIVESADESGSIEGTYKAGYISQYIKPARTNEDVRTSYKPKMFYNVPIEAITTFAERGSMPIKDFMITCALAKFSPPLRELYLYSLGLGNAYVKKALGITFSRTIPPAVFDQIVTNSNQATFGQINRKFTLALGGATAYFVITDDNYKGEFSTYQAAVASEFIGQYYYAPVDQSELDSKNCKADAEIKYENDVVAGGPVEIYAMDDLRDFGKLPYAKFMSSPFSHTLHKAIPYIDTSKEFEEGYDPKIFINGNDESFDVGGASLGEYGDSENVWSRRAYIFRKEAPWGITQDNLASLIASIPIADIMPQFYSLNGTARAYLQNLIVQGKLPTSFQTAIERGSVKMLVTGPASRMRQAFNVSEFEILAGSSGSSGSAPQLPSRVHKHYFAGWQGNMFERVYLGQGDNPIENDSNCQTVCETNLVDEICGTCDFDGEQNRPFVGYPSWTGTKVNVDTGEREPIGPASEFIQLSSRYLTNWAPYIIFPTLLPYQGYVRHIDYKKTTTPAKKEILGFPLPEIVKTKDTSVKYPNSAGTTFNKPVFERNGEYKNKTMGIKVVENLITNDADAALEFDEPDQQGIIQVAIPATNSEITSEINADGVNSIFKNLTLEEYHQRLYDSFKNDAVSTDDPSESFNFTLAGLQFNRDLKELLDPAKGLTNLGVSLDENGTSVDISFATRPPEMPKPQVYMKKIEPKLNVFGR